MRLNFFAASIPGSIYDPRRVLSGFESFADAKERRTNLINILDGGGDDACAVAEILSECRIGVRCQSAACPVCLRRFRIWWCSNVAHHVYSASNARWSGISLVPPDLRYLPGQLHLFDPKIFKDRLRKQLSRGSLARQPFIGGLDFALQEFSDSRRQPEWRPHVYGFMYGSTPDAINTALKRHYPSSFDTPRPLRTRPIDLGSQNIVRAATYSFKSTFDVRKAVSGDDGERDTEKSALGKEYWLELAPLLHEWGYGGRLIRRGTFLHAPFARFR